jgi:hypothetical protein
LSRPKNTVKCETLSSSIKNTVKRCRTLSLDNYFSTTLSFFDKVVRSTTLLVDLYKSDLQIRREIEEGIDVLDYIDVDEDLVIGLFYMLVS